MDEYEDLLFELSRGLPCDGEKGRPLGRAITLAQMKRFAFEQFSELTQAMWESALGCVAPSEAIVQGQEESVWMTVDALLSMDAAFDFQGVLPSISSISPSRIASTPCVGGMHVRRDRDLVGFW